MTYPLKDWKSIKRGYRFGQKTWYSSKHLGLDLMVPTGTPVLAPFDCEILTAAKGFQGGNTITVKLPSDVIMRCMHLRELPLTGKRSEGQILAFSGRSGALVAGDHLHVDLSKNRVELGNFDNFLDPEAYFVQNDDFIKKWEGKFILDVDELGKVYYVSGGFRHYVDPQNFHGFVEKFGTGFTHENILRIPEKL